MDTISKKGTSTDIKQSESGNITKYNPQEINHMSPSVIENVRLKLSDIVGLIEEAKKKIDETKRNFESSVIDPLHYDSTTTTAIILNHKKSNPETDANTNQDKLFDEFPVDDNEYDDDDSELDDLLSRLEINDTSYKVSQNTDAIIEDSEPKHNITDNKLITKHDTEVQKRLDKIVEGYTLLLQDIMRGDATRLVEMMQMRTHDLKTSDYTTSGLNSIGLKIILGCVLNNCIELSGLLYEYYSQRNTPMADGFTHYPRLVSGNNLLVFNLLMLSYSYMVDSNSSLGIKKYSGRVKDRDLAENNVAILRNASIENIKKLGYEYSEKVHPSGKYDFGDLPKDTVKVSAIPVGVIIEAYQKRCTVIQNELRKVLADDLNIRCILICCVGSRILSFDAK